MSMGMDTVCTSKSLEPRQDCWSQGGGMGRVFCLLVWLLWHTVTSNLKSFVFLGTLKRLLPSILWGKLEIKEGKIISKQRVMSNRDARDIFSRAAAVPSGKGPADPRRLDLVITYSAHLFCFSSEGKRGYSFGRSVECREGGSLGLPQQGGRRETFMGWCSYMYHHEVTSWDLNTPVWLLTKGRDCEKQVSTSARLIKPSMCVKSLARSHQALA